MILAGRDAWKHGWCESLSYNKIAFCGWEEDMARRTFLCDILPLLLLAGAVCKYTGFSLQKTQERSTLIEDLASLLTRGMERTFIFRAQKIGGYLQILSCFDYRCSAMTRWTIILLACPWWWPGATWHLDWRSLYGLLSWAYSGNVSCAPGDFIIIQNSLSELKMLFPCVKKKNCDLVVWATTDGRGRAHIWISNIAGNPFKRVISLPGEEGAAHIKK